MQLKFILGKKKRNFFISIIPKESFVEGEIISTNEDIAGES